MMTYDEEILIGGDDPDFAVGEAGKALNQTWQSLNQAMLWIGTLTETDTSGNARIVEESINDGLEAIRRAEKALGLRFIPENKTRASHVPENADDDKTPF